MISIEEAGEMLDEIAEELPQEFYKDLNGGILLLPDVKTHPEPDDYLYILGAYHNSVGMGKYIVIYYGSFERVYGFLSAEQLKEQLRKTLLHEFTHHLEGLAGKRGLEKKDEERMERYRRRFRK